jgi:hypothetical protein
MHLIQKIKQRSIASNAMTLVVTIMLSITLATKSPAAELSGADGAGVSGGHTGGGYLGPPPNSTPLLPPPVFNPSTPYIVPSSPETPVSPASPGSVFGNG